MQTNANLQQPPRQSGIKAKRLNSFVTSVYACTIPQHCIIVFPALILRTRMWQRSVPATSSKTTLFDPLRLSCVVVEFLGTHPTPLPRLASQIAPKLNALRPQNTIQTISSFSANACPVLFYFHLSSFIKLAQFLSHLWWSLLLNNSFFNLCTAVIKSWI